jgi:uncharacterized protein with PIN domain
MKFITTKELGRLAKWLRIMGFDTCYFPETEKRELIVKSLQENRIILTRDSKMSVYSGVKMVHIKSDFVEEQVRQVVDDLDIPINREKFFSICVICNTPLKQVKKEDIKSRVPEYVYKTQEHFMQCAICDRIYWQGTHWTNVGNFFDKLGLDKKGR